MSGLSRRRLLVGGSALVAGLTTPAVARADDITAAGCPDRPIDAAGIGRTDPRYQELVVRGVNRRFTGNPDSVRLVEAPDQIVCAVNDAMRCGTQVAVRSGGHCFENFVDDPAVKMVIDVSEMRDISLDRDHRAISVQSGATLGQVYRTLYLAWGITVPAGTCPDVGVGGHIAGGGYGALGKRYGLAADHLYGVEVVVVDRSGQARKVLATREPNDPNRDLWWAHTGGGGGNFGIVTRYLLRSPDATGTDPAGFLPRPPARLLRATVSWNWSDLTEAVFGKLVRNFFQWHEHSSGNGTIDAGVNAALTLYHKINGQIQLGVQVDGGRADADQLLTGYINAVTAGVTIPNTVEKSAPLWMKGTLSVPPSGDYSFKAKDAFLRRGWTDAQLSTLYKQLSDGSYEFYGTNVSVSYYGGKVNAVAPNATAMVHRDALFSTVIESVWFDPANEPKLVDWVRTTYREVYADTGGVPTPGDAYSGTYINYPDNDMDDPAWNTSGLPWHAFYYGANYPRLQDVKARWDPRDVFKHALSVRPPDTKRGPA